MAEMRMPAGRRYLWAAAHRQSRGSAAPKKRGISAKQSTYQSAVPRKHMVEPLYIGSVWTLKGKPVTEKRKSSVSAAGADIEVD
jgi:hypothetical protein